MKIYLYKYFIAFFCCCYSIAGWAQQSDNKTLIDFNRQLNFYDFEQIRSYVIKHGDRKTYCPNYKDNPHYKVKDLAVEVYFNPTNNDGRQPTENDYNVMYIIEEEGDSVIHYYLYLTPQRDVLVYDYDKQFTDIDTRTFRLTELKNITDYLVDLAEVR